MGLFTAAAKTAILNAMRGSGSAPVVTHMQLHTASPGASGTSNVATGAGATRVAVTFAAESAGVISATGPVTFNVDAGTYTHVSYWTASTGGTCVATDDLPSSQTYGASSTLTLATVTLDLNAAASAS